MKIVTKKKIMVVPWADTSWLYTSALTTLAFGVLSWSRMTSAKTPPMTNERIPVVMYMMPISLWSVVVSQRLIGFQNVSSYVLGRGGASVAIAAPHTMPP